MTPSLNHVPFRVDPLKWESPRGYLCRVAAAHSYASPLWLLKVAGLSSPAESESEHNVAAMAFALRLSEEEWRSMTYLRICGAGRFKKCRFLGHVVAASQLNLGISRVCVHCLIEQSVWWAVWDLGMSAACVRHRCLLSDRCSRCGQALRWNRPAVHLCHCGSDLRRQHATSANCELFAVTEAIYSMAGVAPETRGQVLGFPEELHGLSLDAALTFLQALGSISGNEIKKRSAFAATQLVYVKEVCESAAHALAEWPNGFYSVLSRTMASRVPRVPRLSFVQAFGNFYHYYLKVQSHTEFQFLRNAFVNFAAFKWQGVIRGQHHALTVEVRENAQFIPALQAAKASRTPSCQITALVRKGLIKGFYYPITESQRSKRVLDRPSVPDEMAQ
jgi:TniQ